MRNRRAGQRRWQAVLAACLGAVLSVSCGSGSPQGRSTGTTGGNKDASLGLNKSSLDFGNIQVGTTKSVALVLTNSSASDGPSITFSQVTTTGTGFSAHTSSLPIVLAPGDSSTVSVTFAPKAAGSVTGSLSIVVDGASDPSNVPLTGTALGASQLGVSPSTLSFGTVAVGSSLNKAGTLTAGTSDVRVSSADWSGQGYSLSGISFPVTVPAGTSLSFTVTFAPEAAGSSPGSVSFVSDATNSPTTEKFSGTGSQTPSSGSGSGSGSGTGTGSGSGSGSGSGTGSGSGSGSGSGTGTQQHTVNLSWASSSSAVIGYYVYRGTQSGGPYSQLTPTPQTDTAYSDSTVQSGQTYYYVVTSVDSDSVESNYSNQAKAVVPSP